MIPTSSVADAEMVTLPETVFPVDGLTSVTVGGVMSEVLLLGGAETVTIWVAVSVPPELLTVRLTL